MSAPMLIILEGNISAGKTTLAKDLAKRLDIKVFLEPTLTNPYLELFYDEPLKYGLKMQIWLLRQRYFTFIAAIRHMLSTGQGVILDRSVFSDAVFANKGRIDGTITEEGFDFYTRLRNKILSVIPIPQVTLYLDVPPEVCQERIRSRSRNCESGIPLGYLSGLDEQYKLFIQDMKHKGSFLIKEDWEAFGSSAGIAAAIEGAREAARVAGESFGWTADEVAALRTLVNDEDAVMATISIDTSGVAGIEDDDPLPPPVDFDLEAKLDKEAEDKRAADANADDIDIDETCDNSDGDGPLSEEDAVNSSFSSSV